MGTLTLKQAAQWCGGTVAPEFERRTFSGACMDSRTIQKGQLFIALSGAGRDGHDFAPQAMAQGAGAVLAQRPLTADIPAIYVPDVLRALGDLARAVRKNLDLKVVGITGSVGKTTTKEMMAAILSTSYPTAKTDKNYNNNIGLPMTILDIGQESRMAVLEMGMNHFKEMSYLTSIALPDIAVITNIGTMHIEHLGSREGILQAKLEILEGLQTGGTAVLNGDEPLLWNEREKHRETLMYFGIENERCDVQAYDIETEENGVSFRVRGLGQEFQAYMPVEGRHYVYDALAAVTVGLLCGVPPVRIQDALSAFHNTGMRQKIYETNGFTVIEDCYNAGPESMDAALSVLAGHKTSGRRIAVLGDMLELGSCSQAEHYRIGRLAAARADMVFAYGKNSERMVSGAVTGGMRESCVKSYQSHEELAQALRCMAKAGDVLLFKGSRGMKMEHVLQLFLQTEEEK